MLHAPVNTAGGVNNLTFDLAGQAVLDAWSTKLHARLSRHDLHPAFEAHLIKYRSLMPSLALLYQVLDDLANGNEIVNVGVVATQAAVRWCDYLASHARRIYGANISPEVDGARSILKHILNGDVLDRTSLSAVYLKHWRNADSPEKAQAAMRVLTDYRLGTVRTVAEHGREASPGGARESAGVGGSHLCRYSRGGASMTPLFCLY